MKTGKNKVLSELADMLRGAAMQFIVMCVISATFIVLSNTSDTALKIVAVVLGEVFIFLACGFFGIQNGSYAYRRTVSSEKKSKEGETEWELNIQASSKTDVYDYTIVAKEPASYVAGTYAPWKGFVISFLTTIPFLIFQIIYCCVPSSSFCYFVLQYAFGWGVGIFDAIGGIAQPLYLLMVLYPVAVHGVGYILGAKREQKRQQVEQKVTDIKNRKQNKKK
jgi:hypothetical protein